MAYINGQKESITMVATYGEATAYLKIKSFFNKVFLQNKNKRIDIVCVGTDKVLFDSVGPLIGTFLKEKIDAPIFGTLADQVNKKNVLQYIEYYQNNSNPNRVVIAIDACLGEKVDDRLGDIHMENTYLVPAAGVGAPQGYLGDYSVKIVTCTNSKNITGSAIGLNSIYEYARLVSEAIIASYNECIETHKDTLEDSEHGNNVYSFNEVAVAISSMEFKK